MIKIAIIDDEASSITMLQEGLAKNKEFQITTYSNPTTALSAIRAGSVNVVLCDIVMPQMDGIEVLEKLKEKDSNLVVIMMTAQSSLDRVLHSHKIGADHYILKPFGNISDIEKKILTLCANR
jgi:DNA-binding NtrC family response regulator